MIRKPIVALAALVLGVVASLTFGSVAGAQYTPVCSVTAAPSSAAPGATVTLSGFVDDGIEAKARVPSQEVSFTIDGLELGSAVTDAEGNFSTEVTIPAELAPGEYTITANCGDFGEGDILGNTDIRVTGSTTPTTPGGGGNQGNNGGNQGGGSSGSGGSGSTGGGTLARTGTDLGLPVQIGVALLALGGIALALSASRRRNGATA